MSELTLRNGEAIPFPEVARYYSARPDGVTPSLIVLHHTAGHAAIDLPILLGHTEREVSAHFFIDKAGHIRQLVRLADAAWHAGASCWRGRKWVNAFSIGIEMENLGNEPWPEEQVLACVRLCQALMQRFSIPSDHIVSHRDIACWIEDDRIIWEKHGARRKIDPAGWPWPHFRALLAE